MARLARQVGETSKRIHFYGETVSAGNRHLGSFSAEIGCANLALGLGDLSRTYRLARATEGSAASLARSINQARNSWQGYNEVRANARNLLGGGAAGLDSVAGAASSVMAKVGEAMAESLIRKLNPALAKDRTRRRRSARLLALAESRLCTVSFRRRPGRRSAPGSPMPWASSRSPFLASGMRLWARSPPGP